MIIMLSGNELNVDLKNRQLWHSWQETDWTSDDMGLNLVTGIRLIGNQRPVVMGGDWLIERSRGREFDSQHRILHYLHHV